MKLICLLPRCFENLKSTPSCCSTTNNFLPHLGVPFMPLSPRHFANNWTSFLGPGSSPMILKVDLHVHLLIVTEHTCETKNLHNKNQNKPNHCLVQISFNLHTQNLLSSDTNLMQSPLYLPSRNPSSTQRLHNRLEHPQGTKYISKTSIENPYIQASKSISPSTQSDFYIQINYS